MSTATPETITIRMPFADIPGAEALAEQVREARVGNHDERVANLTGLIMATEIGTKASPQTLLDQLLEKATDPELEQAEQRATNAISKVIDGQKRKVGDKFFDIVMDSNGDVEDVRVGIVIPVKEAVQNRAMRSADRQGWGPKQNRSSFRTRE